MFQKIRQWFCRHYYDDSRHFSPDCRHDTVLICTKCGKEIVRRGS